MSEVTAPADGESTNLYGKIAVLISGQAIAPGTTDPIVAPASLDLAEASFNGSAKVLFETHSLQSTRMAERAGFEPRYLAVHRFPMLHNRPLCHLSKIPKRASTNVSG